MFTLLRDVHHRNESDQSRWAASSQLSGTSKMSGPIQEQGRHVIDASAPADMLWQLLALRGEHEPIFKRFLSRAPWLLVTLCSGIVTATVMSHFFRT